jgi:hypothetical protein
LNNHAHCLSSFFSACINPKSLKFVLFRLAMSLLFRRVVVLSAAIFECAVLDPELNSRAGRRIASMESLPYSDIAGNFTTIRIMLSTLCLVRAGWGVWSGCCPGFRSGFGAGRSFFASPIN